MQPKRIILIRHAESEANMNKELYQTIPEQSFQLTSKGVEQAQQTGMALKKIIHSESAQVYVSPYLRTRQTFAHIRSSMNENLIKVFEEPRIREQEWGHFQTPQSLVAENRARLKYGLFYYRIKDGESPADVYTRVSSFNETLYREFQMDDYPDNCIIISHGMTIRVFLMAWLRKNVAYFESLKNPHNCQLIVLEHNEQNSYTVTTPLETRKVQ